MGSAGWEAIRKIVWEAMMVPGEGLHWPLPVSIGMSNACAERLCHVTPIFEL